MRSPGALPRVEVPVTGGKAVIIYGVDSRPYLCVDNLCDVIGIDIAPQQRRVKRHAAEHNLDRVLLQIEFMDRVLIPLEEFSWFLRTLRPTSINARVTVGNFQKQGLWRLIRAWLRHEKGFIGGAKAHELIRAGEGDQARGLDPANRKRLCIEDAEEMRRLRAQGMSMSQIGERLRFSASTVSLVLRDKYPCVLKPRDPAVTR